MPAPAKKPESLSAFGDKATPPTEAALRRTLGPAAAGAWAALVDHVGGTYPPAVERWSFAGAKYGWSLRLVRGDRVILYLIPRAGHFLVGIVLGGKAVAAAQDAGLPASVLEAIAAAPRYAEGTGLRLPVSEEGQLPPIHVLVALKMARR
jgi:hypothetical protein